MMRLAMMIGIVAALLAEPGAASAQSRSRGKTPTLTDMFPREQMDCGKRGWTFTGLLGGSVPLTACVLKYKGNAGKSPFGPL